MDALEMVVGQVFDYPLLGGETLYELLYPLNNQFGLTMNTAWFSNNTALLSPDDQLITLQAVSHDRSVWYSFKNLHNVGVRTLHAIGLFDPPKSNIIFHNPVFFEQEMGFLKTVPLNIMINYDGLNPRVNALYGYIKKTSPVELAPLTQYDSLILRYFGRGDNVPSLYGTFNAKQLIAIVELKRQNASTIHCLRNRIYHVYRNGYRSRD